MPSIHIMEDTEEHREEKEISDNLSLYLTPEEAEGELVEFEMPGSMGRDIYRIVSVDLDEMETIVEKYPNGEKYKIEESFLPPSPHHFRTPRIGSEHSVCWKEHLNGRGEWVRTTPKVDSRRAAQIYYGRYSGHEKTRIVETTYIYTPPGVVEYDIWFTSDGIRVHLDEEIDGLQQVYNQIDVDKISPHTTVGKVYINPDNEVINYYIERNFRVESYKTPTETLNNAIV